MTDILGAIGLLCLLAVVGVVVVLMFGQAR